MPVVISPVSPHEAPVLTAPTSIIDTSVLPAQVQRMLSPTAPAGLRNMGAKGIAPGLKPDAVVTLICAFAVGQDVTLAQTAVTTLESLPGPILQGALSCDLQGPVLELLARAHHTDEALVARMLLAKSITSAALEYVAEKANERIGELVAATDSVLLRFPRVIEKLYMNKRVRMSTADRLVDLAVRNGLELDIPAFQQAAAAIANELIAEPTQEPSFDDQLFQQAEQIAQAQGQEVPSGEDTHEVDEEGDEVVVAKFKPLYAQIADMTISQKIRRATLGTGAERMIFVREANRLVATAAASSPLLKEADAIRIAANRNVIDDVLRIIARNREFTRCYQVKFNLVTNPKTPFTFSSRMIPHLRVSDLRKLEKSKAIPAAIRKAVGQQLSRTRR